jgi:hypothetical protein
MKFAIQPARVRVEAQSWGPPQPAYAAVALAVDEGTGTIHEMYGGAVLVHSAERGLEWISARSVRFLIK